MPIAAEHCPNCGAPLELDAARACFFCRAQLMVTTPAGEPDREVVARAMDPNGVFAMEVEDVFAIRGRGTIATGVIGSGSVRVGDALVIDSARGRRLTRCLAIEMFRKKLDVAVAGNNAGLMLEGVDKGDVQRGDRIRHA